MAFSIILIYLLLGHLEKHAFRLVMLGNYSRICLFNISNAIGFNERFKQSTEPRASPLQNVPG